MGAIHILDGVRTPHGEFLGGLADATAIDLGATALEALLARTDAPPERVEWVGLGNSISAGLGQVPARQVALAGGLPSDVAATTVNEASGSGLRALALAVDRLEAGRAALAVAGGMESMSNAPHLLGDLRSGHRLGDVTLRDAMIHDALWDQSRHAHMGELTERLVDRFSISRRKQDEYAAESHQRAARAVRKGRFDDELVPVEVDGERVARDEGPRPETTSDRLAGLDPAFEEGGSITAGNASDLSDGAACLLLGTEAAAEAAGVEPLARVLDYAVAYRDPEWFGMAVADAVEALLAANDLAVSDVDVFELNEAFAAQMVYTRERLEIPREELNPRGGAVALGHPIGASGGILTTTLVHTLRDRGASLGVVGMSIGGGGGIAMLVRAE